MRRPPPSRTQVSRMRTEYGHNYSESSSYLSHTFSIAGTCPPEWDTCSLLLRTTVDFIHDESLRGGELIYSLYKFADAITATVARQIPKVQVLYIGPRDVAAKFAITLNGVPKGVTMNAVQQQYFADVTVDFLSASSSGNSVLDLQVDEQIDNDGSIQVVGKLLGASYRPAATYVNGLENAFREGRDMYMQKLFLDKLRPHPINERGGTEFFEGIVSVGGRVDIDTDAPTLAPAPAPKGQDDGGGGSPILIITIAVAAGALVFTFFACWYRWNRVTSRKEKDRRRALRQEAKENLLGHDEDPEQTHGFRETLPHTSSRRLTILAGDADYTDDSESLQLANEDASGSSVTNSCDEVSRSAKTSADQKSERIPANEDVTQEREQSSTAAVSDQSANVDEDTSSDSHRRRPPIRASKSFRDDSTDGFPKKRAPPKTTKSLDGNEFSVELGLNRAPNKVGAASEAPTSTGASTAALSRFMKAEPKASVNWMSGSRSIMSQSRIALGDMFRNLKEAEEAENAEDTPSGSQRTNPQFRAHKSFEDDSPVGPPRKRTPPKATKSLDRNDFRNQLGHNQLTYIDKIEGDSDKRGKISNAPTSAKLNGSPPAASSTLMKAHPYSSANASTMTSSRSVQLKSSTDKISPDRPPRRRAPPKSTKSLNGNDFRSQLGHNRVTSDAKIDDGGDSLVTATNAHASAKVKSSSLAVLPHLLASFGDNIPETKTDKRKLLKSAKSLNGHVFKSKIANYAIPYLASKIDNDERANEFKELTMVDTGPQSHVSECPGDKAALDGSPRRRAPLKAAMLKAAMSLERNAFSWYLDDNRVTKAQDVNEFNWQLDDNRVTKTQDESEFRWQLDDSGKRGTVSKALCSSAKAKGPPPAAASTLIKAEPDSSANTMTSSHSVKVEPSTDKTAPDGPPRRRAPPKPTTSLDRNAFKSRLPKPSKSLDETAFKSKFVPYTIPYLPCKIENDERANEFMTLSMVDTGPQHESFKSEALKVAEDVSPSSQRTQFQFRESGSIKNDSPGDSRCRRAPPKAAKLLDRNDFRRKLDRNGVQSLRKINEVNDTV